MSLKNFQYEAIMRDYNQKQFLHKHEQDEHIRLAEERIPRLGQIRREIAALGLKKARLVLGAQGGEDFDLASAIGALAGERKTLLLENGFPADYLELHYDCPICKDTGYINGEKCACFRKAAVDLLYTQSNIRDILEEENFENFSFQYYSPDFTDPASGITASEAAHNAYDKAWAFIESFAEEFNNLMIYGDTGVGKTYLTHCIAKELLASFIYDCDLLIIDDLGTELTNSFVSSQLFCCINERIMNKKATIISTNLTMEDFLDTYSERTFSRVSSNYIMIKLIGNDIRIQKRLLGGK